MTYTRVAHGNPGNNNSATDATIVVNAMQVGIERLEAAAFNVKAYGAVGDGVTDDTTTIALAITALNADGGGFLFFPKGTYRTSPITLTSGMRIEGVGNSSVLTTASGPNGTTNLLTIGAGATVFNVGIRNISLQGSGNLVNVPAGATFAWQSIIENVQMVAYGATKSAIYCLGSWIGVVLRNCEISGKDTVGGTTVPLIYLRSSLGGGVNGNSFRDTTFLAPSFTQPCIFVEETPEGSYAYDNLFDGLIFENARGGAIHVSRGQETKIANCGVWDLTGATGNHLIYLTQPAGATYGTSNTTIENFQPKGVTLGGGFFHVAHGPGGSGGRNTVFINCDDTSRNGTFAVDFATQSHVFIGGTGYVAAGSNDDYVSKVGVGYTSRDSATVTGNRPTAASVGPGGRMYDTTLGKPIWSNGTVWKDAAGGTV